MSTLIGKYVPTFAEATHALPQGMHMNADYPFMLPAIIGKDSTMITIVGRNHEMRTVRILRRKGGEYAWLEQSSTFEKLYGRKPAKFKLLPFLDTGGK